MLKWIACSFVVSVLAFGATPAEAKGKRKQLTPEERFTKMDKNGDGTISLAEFVGKAKGDKLEKREAVFKAKDADNDGALTLDEFKTRIKKAKKK